MQGSSGEELPFFVADEPRTRGPAPFFRPGLHRKLKDVSLHPLWTYPQD